MKITKNSLNIFIHQPCRRIIGHMKSSFGGKSGYYFAQLMAGPYAQDIKAMAGNYLARFLGQLTPTHSDIIVKGEIGESTQRNCHCTTRFSLAGAEARARAGAFCSTWHTLPTLPPCQSCFGSCSCKCVAFLK